ncbi:glycosyltransferase family 39 protein [Roseimicrobium sp. ORNL1]|uniref:glycosyltransferase family 39 protein n=1 Tax=Roseimicrobium sp. ORNL1 TaxID=2711231 RepID=UPI0013E1B45B|nr:glycosyltransferase family 39 protein [Roseimicrobium sp. ORNL1]QIF04363.1 glycosyltransferase family 39 protein [Roseimicrobium sp. ORNL1]
MPRFRSLLTPLNFGRLILLGVLLVSTEQLDEMRPPWKSAWARHIAEGKEPTFGEHLSTGLWYGAAARVGICGALLAVSFLWGVGLKRSYPSPTPLSLARPDDAAVSPRTFALVLGVIVAGSLVLRLPRMTHSFWGDEADAMATYVHGNFRPAEKNEPEGRLYFEQPTWGQSFFSARHGANNHVLFTLASRTCLNGWRLVTGQPQTAFVEWAARLPSLIAGLGSLVTLALLLRRWGLPTVGLLAAAVMSIHPWHVRYTAEARGYALMLLLMPILLIVLTNALEKNLWRDWLLFALGEFLLMYSWAGIMYGLAALNVAAAVLMLLRKDRLPLLVRWTTANMLAAVVFVSLYLPHLPQIESARKRLLWIKGLPMDKVWFHNLITQPFTGISYHEMNAGNPSEMSWERLFRESPAITSTGFAIILLAFAVGFVALWRRNRSVAWLVSAILGASVVCTLHFKFILKDELRAWYLIFTLPFISLCVALGLYEITSLIKKCAAQGPSPLMARTGAVIVCLLLIGASTWPMNASLITQPEEDYKGVVAASLSRHESFAPDTASKVHVVWLWRFSALYDPRGESRARNLPDLKVYMEKALQSGRELYVVVGFRELAKLKSADILAVLEDPAQYESVVSFPSRESLHTLDVYRMKRSGASALTTNKH